MTTPLETWTNGLTQDLMRRHGWLLEAAEQIRCGAAFEPENGCQECWFCGRMLHAECTAYHEEESK